MATLSPQLRRGRFVAGVIATLIGLVTTGGVVAAMNGALTPPPKPPAAAAVAFEVQQKKPPPPRPKPKPKPKPKRRSNAPPTPLLTAGLGGMSFGIPGLEGSMQDVTDQLIGDVGDVVMTEDTVDQPPRPAQRTQPDYPVRARRQFITGYVTLSLLVGTDGSVDDVRVLEAEPRGVFEEVALAAVRQWRFQPAMYQGRPVPVRARQTVRFELE